MDRLKNVAAHVLAVAIIAFGFALAILMALGIYNGFGRREAYKPASLRDGTYLILRAFRFCPTSS